MLIEQTDSYTLLKPDADKIVNKKEIITNFYNLFNKNYINFNNVNLILDFSENINLELQEILLFSHYNKIHNKKNKSFVIAGSGINFDEIIDEMVIVPTLTEAKDIIELENIERDLGI